MRPLKRCTLQGMADSRPRSSVPIFPFVVGILACAMITGVLLRDDQSEPEPGSAPERAHFMVECVVNFQYTPATCRQVLDGGDPPERPDAMGHPGC